MDRIFILVQTLWMCYHLVSYTIVKGVKEILKSIWLCPKKLLSLYHDRK
jgi:hypothetical protein